MITLLLIILIISTVWWGVSRFRSRPKPENVWVPPKSRAAYYDGEAVVLDVETTGLDPARDRIISACAARLEKLDGRSPKDVAADAGLVWLIDPGCTVPKSATKVHGITTEMLRQEGEPSQAAITEILDYIGSSPVICHNASFDHAFLKAEAERIGRKFENKVFCTLKGFKRHRTQLGIDARSNRLGDIAKKAGWKIHGGKLHDAETDAILCCMLFLSIRAVGGLKRPVKSESYSFRG